MYTLTNIYLLGQRFIHKNTYYLFQKIFLLKQVYGHVKDVDLLAAMWIEKTMEGGHIPLMFANIINDNIMRALKSDRHWYERPNRPDAFTRGK